MKFGGKVAHGPQKKALDFGDLDLDPVIIHCALAAAQCIVIGPVCLWVCVGGSVTTITRNCVHRFSPKWVCR